MDINIFISYHNLLTLTSRTNRTAGVKPNKANNFEFMSVFYGQPLTEFKQPKYKIGEKVRISKIDLPFRKCYKLQFTENVLEIIAIGSKKFRRTP